MAIKNIQDLFIHQLSDIYSAEKQLARALPKLARAAANQDLADAFDKHLEETRGQIERIDKIVDTFDLNLKRVKAHGMEGLIDETRDILDALPEGALRDAALIGGAQKAEHYEIAAYGTLCTLAGQLGHTEAVDLLRQTLEEEKATDSKLTQLAEQGINEQAVRSRRGSEAGASEARH